MSFIVGVVERAKRHLSREPVNENPAKLRIITGCIVLVASSILSLSYLLLQGSVDLLLWSFALSTGAATTLSGAGDLLYANRRTLAMLLRLVNIPVIVLCITVLVLLYFRLFSGS